MVLQKPLYLFIKIAVCHSRNNLLNDSIESLIEHRIKYKKRKDLHVKSK